MWMLLIAALCTGLSLDNLATTQPSSCALTLSLSLAHLILSGVSDLSPIAPRHPALRVAVTGFLSGLICLCVALWTVLKRRFSNDDFSQLLSMLSLSNLSLLCFSDHLHAVYVHGKSVHQSSEVPLPLLNQQLQSERDHQSAERGLEPGRQTYRWLCAPDIRLNYDTFLSRCAVLRRANNAAASAASSGQFSTGDALSAVLALQVELSKFFASFIERSSASSKWTIAQYGVVAHFLSSYEFFPSLTQFFYDRSALSLCLLESVEWSMFRTWLLLLLTAQVTLDNTLAACVIVALVNWAVMALHATYAQRNLSQKTMIDSNFLIV